MAEPAAPLVSAQWLKEHQGDPAVVVLDVRSAIDGGGAEAYAQAHIPGAVHSDYDKAGWRVTRNGVPFMLPNTAELEKLIGETGIDEDSHVVVVPAGVSATDFGAAARVYWTLKIAGHPAVSILDGGFAAWQAAAYPVESGKVTPSPRIFTVKLDERSARRGRSGRAQRARHARRCPPRELFRRQGEGAGLQGLWPHSRRDQSSTAPAFYDPVTNRLRPKEQLAKIAASLPAGPVVAYCNTGHWAATDWFVLSAVLGRPDVRLYDGSMVEWTADPHRPVASSRTRLDDLKKTLGLGS